MKAFLTILLLVTSNIFMTFAWYGHLKLQEMKISTGWPVFLVILFSWGLAFFEYCAQVPANRIGFSGNGGPVPGKPEGVCGPRGASGSYSRLEVAPNREGWV